MEPARCHTRRVSHVEWQKFESIGHVMATAHESCAVKLELVLIRSYVTGKIVWEEVMIASRIASDGILVKIMICAERNALTKSAVLEKIVEIQTIKVITERKVSPRVLVARHLI